jgi:hypothetical protein
MTMKGCSAVDQELTCRYCAATVPGGACVITMRLPERDGEFEYRVKSANEPHERVARESQLTTDL